MENSFVLDFKDALKKEGLKFTNQRYAIFKFLLNLSQYFKTSNIYKIFNVIFCLPPDFFSQNHKKVWADFLLYHCKFKVTFI